METTVKMSKEEMIERIEKTLVKYWSKKINKPCASLFAIRSTVYDELANMDVYYFRKIKREQVNEIAIRIKNSL